MGGGEGDDQVRPPALYALLAEQGAGSRGTGKVVNLPDKWFWRFVSTLFKGSELQRKLAIQALHASYRPWCWPFLWLAYWRQRRKVG